MLRKHPCLAWLPLACCLTFSPVSAQPEAKKSEILPVPRSLVTPTEFSARAIDLPSALQLGGVYNPEILRAQEAIAQALAERRLAAAQILPSLNIGTNLDHHTGNLQQSQGQIIAVNRDSLFGGLGANAVGSGTVNIPGVVWNLNVSQAIYAALVRRQAVQQREFFSEAIRNDVLLRVAVAYVDLLRGTGRRAVAIQIREDAREVARVTANFAKTGQGRQADADRAATEFEFRNNEVVLAEEAMLLASARLAQLLHLDPSERLYPIDGQAVPAGIVPDPVPLPDLIAVALMQRPELKERQAAIRAAFLELKGARMLPFSPSILAGYSIGTFGGGSNLVANGIVQGNGTVLKQSRFGNFDDRQDLDIVLFWTLRNLGVGNAAIVRIAQTRLRQDQLRQMEVLDLVRSQVASAHARTQARLAQIETSERAVKASQDAFKQDFIRTRNREGLPIEVLDSLRLLGRSRQTYLDAILDYNRAQFELYVAIGQPPAVHLARPVPAVEKMP